MASAKPPKPTANEFLRGRDTSPIGAVVVDQWSRTLRRGATVIELACGGGYPITRALETAGLQVWQGAMVKLFFWGARALYLGPAAGLSPHRNAVAVLCAGVHDTFGIARDPRRPRAGYVARRTVLIPANTLHHLRAGPALMAFLYVDAQSEDFRRLRASAADTEARYAHGLAGEQAYVATLQRLASGRPWREASEAIAGALDLA